MKMLHATGKGRNMQVHSHPVPRNIPWDFPQSGALGHQVKKQPLGQLNRSREPPTRPGCPCLRPGSRDPCAQPEQQRLLPGSGGHREFCSGLGGH